jgi:hypothetical protein
VFAADGQSSVQVIDISDPYTPAGIASIPVGAGWYAQEVVVLGTTLYVGSEAYGKVALQIVDVAVPAAPVTRSTLVFSPGYPVGAGDLAVAGSTAYLTDSSAGLHVIDVSNPATPLQIGALGGPANAVKAFGSHLLLGRGASLEVVDVENPAAPVVVGTVALPAAVDDIAFAGDTALLAIRDAGLVTLDVSDPRTPQVVATSRATNQALDVALSGTLAHVADGAFGLKVMDVSDPLVPQLVGQVDTPGSAVAVTLSGSIAWVADSAAGARAIDVQDPAQPALLGGYDTQGSAVEIAVAGGRAYVADGAAGLVVLDVTQPSAPAFLGKLAFPCVNAFATSLFVSGSLVYATDTYYGLRIVDVSNPASPVLLSTTDTYSYANDVVVRGQIAYVVDFSKRVYAIDVGNPVAPIVLWSGPQNSSAHKVVLDGNRLFLSQSQGGYLESYDISVPGTPALQHSVWAPTGGAGMAVAGGILLAGHGSKGLWTFRMDGLPFVRGPEPAVGCAGSSVTFHVSAAGQTQSGAQALGYTWRRNGVALGDGPTGSGSTVSGALTPALAIAGLSPADAGTYDCEVANACGTTLSAAAALALSGVGCPINYCTAKTALACGTPAIHFTGFPSASASSGFEGRSAPARAARLGILLYGNQGRTALPFQGGTLCVQSPSRAVPASS